MPYIPQFNPQVVSPGRFRRFNGVLGGPNVVNKKSDSAGRDLSDGYCNDQQDLNSDINGMLHLREGFTRLGSGKDASIHSIFEVKLGGKKQYGIVDGSLTLYDIPYIKSPTIPLPPEKPEEPPVPTDFPTSFDRPDKKQPKDDAPVEDPSVPPDDQSCEVSHTHSTSPTTLNFTMQKGGALPDAQNWFWEVKGWWDYTHVGTYNVRPSWFSGYQLISGSSWVKPCVALTQGQVRCTMTTAAQSLDAGSYTFDHSLVFNDGGTHACTINLTVTEGTMSATGGSISKILGDSFATTTDLTVSNGTAGTNLAWSAAIISDTSGQLQLSSTSGTISGIGSTSITPSFSSDPSAGSYTAVVRFSTSNGTPSTIDVNVTITVTAPYSGSLNFTGTNGWTANNVARFSAGTSVPGYAYGHGARWNTPAVGGARIEYIVYYITNPGGGIGAIFTGPGWYAQVWEQGADYGQAIGGLTFPTGSKTVIRPSYWTYTFNWTPTP